MSKQTNASFQTRFGCTAWMRLDHCTALLPALSWALEAELCLENPRELEQNELCLTSLFFFVPIIFL